MRTRELIDILADDARAVPPMAAQRRLGMVALAGAAIALALVLMWLKLRPDLAQAMAGHFFWMRAAYTAALAAAGFWATERLARPGVSARTAMIAGGVVFAVIAVVALMQMMPMDRAARMAAMRGHSWQICSLNIVILAAPMTLIGLAVLRGLAPTRPMAAGFAAGAFAGALAATVYGLHCPEATFIFIGIWYTLGVAVSGLIGALLGRFMLRW